MRCDACPFGNKEDVCPEAEGKYGITHQDGVLGCKHPRIWVEKRDKSYCDYLGNMGIDMGIEMDLGSERLGEAIEICKHMIGLDNAKPYKRHGKLFYKPYRNYFEAPSEGNPILDKLPEFILTRKDVGVSVLYRLNTQGLEWLARQTNIKIGGMKNEQKG